VKIASVIGVQPGLAAIERAARRPIPRRGVRRAAGLGGLLSGLVAVATACTSDGSSTSQVPVAPDCPTFVAASAGLPETGEWRTHPAIGDVNGDGLGDIAALSRKGKGASIFLGDGLGNWTERSEGLDAGSGSISCGVGVRLVDLDRDGSLDLLVADHCRGILVYRGDGAGSWTGASRGIPRNVEGFNDADTIDLDGDGILDIVAVSAFSRGFLALEGSAAGRWTILADTGLPETGSGFEIEIADADGDGLDDIVTTFNPTTTERRTPPPPPAMVWLQGPRGRFRPASEFPREGRFFGVATVPSASGRGRDLYFGLTGAHAGLHHFEPTAGAAWRDAGRLDAAWFETRSPGFIGIAAADVDGDGCADLALNGGHPMGAHLALGDCRGGFALCPPETFPLTGRAATWGITVGDLNGDGRPDVVAGYGDGGRGSLRAWFQAGRTAGR